MPGPIPRLPAAAWPPGPLPALASSGEMDPLVHDIGMCLLFAGVLTVLFARLRIPTIAALLLAGILLGPETPGTVVDRGSIGTIASLGIVLLLFLIGLEIDLRRLLDSGRTLLVAGVLQFPLCVGLGAGAAWLAARAGWGALAGGYVPLYVGITVSASSTLVVVRLLQERFQLDTAVGRVAVGVLILQDVWAIVVLAAQPNFAEPRLGVVAGNLVGIALLAGVALLLARTLVPRALRWISGSPELLLVAAVAWCFGIGFLGTNLGFLAERAGLHVPIAVSLEMGALLAGATLATHPFSHHIVSRVAVVHDFFITLFFVALGAGIPRPDGPGVLLLAAAMAAGAMLSRYAVLLPLLYATGMDRRSALVASTRLASISEFCLVIAYLGRGLGHVDDAFVGAATFAFVGAALAAPLTFDAGDRIHRWSGGLLTRLGMRPPGSADAEGPRRAPPDVVFLGFHRVASSLHHEIARRHPALLERLLVVDFNAAIHPAIEKRGSRAHYGDLSDLGSLRAAGALEARVAVCTVPDDLLRGTTNARLVRMLRLAAPRMVILANSLTLRGVRELYDAGADYVYLRRVEAAVNLAPAVVAALDGGIAVYRKDQEALYGAPEARDEVLP